MAILSAFEKNPENICYFGEDTDEKILYLLRRSHITNIGWVILVGILIAAPLFFTPYLWNLQIDGHALLSPIYITILLASWYLMVTGFTLFKFFNWFFNVYLITNKKIVDFDFYGLTYKNIADTTLSNVEDVTAKISGPINMVFNIGDVFVQTAAENREFDFAQIDDPGRVRDIISDLIADIKK
jgi:membrane protein YdbS with pleckstrin-like domain